ncbi:APH(3') family aminoglycoside O-phosphotransferase [Spirosoma rhododendri]|uniref:Aminoglycoside 3'-phosphotransferase n=1 Tax=Spirosoma rhododendri TaxID=2728024 RepID=A0A7L5DR72_9BACT|nr:APH(3') family aminoglycoside O-phosphotransferase [Spirosoma rhododendri]QJD79951.1 aminoglycoside 3'-phosphotransferase [Spirosoma rhododendri]
MQFDQLPPALQRLLPHTDWRTDSLGMSSAQTVYINGREPFYLKVNPVDPWGGLRAEADALIWLRTYLPAPEVVSYERADGVDYLLMRALTGLPSSDESWKASPERLVRRLAESLRTLHDLNPATCPFDQRNEVKLSAVTANVAHNLVDTDNFSDPNQGRSPQAILDQLRAQQPAQRELVVTHGDFCLPNLILDNWSLSGFIDVGRLGVGDPYQDLALCIRDLTDELETDRYNELFFATYGLTDVDTARMRYFTLLDELN